MKDEILLYNSQEQGQYDLAQIEFERAELLYALKYVYYFPRWYLLRFKLWSAKKVLEILEPLRHKIEVAMGPEWRPIVMPEDGSLLDGFVVNHDLYSTLHMRWIPDGVDIY